MRAYEDVPLVALLPVVQALYAVLGVHVLLPVMRICVPAHQARAAVSKPKITVPTYTCQIEVAARGHATVSSSLDGKHAWPGSVITWCAPQQKGGKCLVETLAENKNRHIKPLR